MINTSPNCRRLDRGRNCLPLKLINVIDLHKQAQSLHFDVSGYSVILSQNMHTPNISVVDTNFPLPTSKSAFKSPFERVSWIYFFILGIYFHLDNYFCIVFMSTYNSTWQCKQLSGQLISILMSYNVFWVMKLDIYMQWVFHIQINSCIFSRSFYPFHC